MTNLLKILTIFCNLRVLIFMNTYHKLDGSVFPNNYSFISKDVSESSWRENKFCNNIFTVAIHVCNGVQRDDSPTNGVSAMSSHALGQE